eukprot:gnl/Spiro4/13284_TR7058_c0_g1_i1.p1 gnl/Spiro4/13284_TR7058_c0_g1~~gnl/Spiro4/13284_TR7058_c0_g1_i1.p1  ORF type:complete len:617 (-),score=206.34 gnl/Spiro4/13284_TR7058_c0_g1_i1:32-1834(-)
MGSSLSSSHPIPLTITIGNSCEAIGPEQFDWTTFVKPSVEGLVRSVTFDLHRTFNPPSVTVNRPPFLVQRSGWGSFKVRLAVTLANGETRNYIHKLVLEPNQTSQKTYNVAGGVQLKRFVGSSDAKPDVRVLIQSGGKYNAGTITEVAGDQITVRFDDNTTGSVRPATATLWVLVAGPTVQEESLQVTNVHTHWLQQGVSEVAAEPSAVNLANLPIVDWSLWRGTAEMKQHMVSQLRDALATHGFFFLQNHGVPQDLIDDTMQRSQEFFQTKRNQEVREELERISAKERMDFRSPPMKTMRGYSPIRAEALNPLMGRDLKESFDYGRDVTPGDTTYENCYIGLSRWPSEGGPDQLARPGFRTTAQRYLNTVHGLAQDVLRAVALSLELDERALDEYFVRPLLVNRFLKYPPQHKKQRRPDEMGAGSHVDFGALTFVYQEMQGLELLDERARQWKFVPVVPGTYVVNAGYILEKLTNGRYVAAKHRVINHHESMTRYTLATFFDPDPHATIGPLPKFVTSETPARFAACVSGHKGVLFRHDTNNTRAGAPSSSSLPSSSSARSSSRSPPPPSKSSSSSSPRKSPVPTVSASALPTKVARKK